jgi:L-serine dehydratase
MSVSVFDIFKIGIGPSSSHTVGPMKAAAAFIAGLEERGALPRITRVSAELFGSLALTGVGHGTDQAVLLGLSGEQPDTIDPDRIQDILSSIRTGNRISLAGRHDIAFDEAGDLTLHRAETLPGHPNGMRFTAFDANGTVLDTRIYYSIGGGFVVSEEEMFRNERVSEAPPVPYDFVSGSQMLETAAASGLRTPAKIT